MMKILMRVVALMLCTMPVMAKEPSLDQKTQAVASAVQQLHQAMIDADSAVLSKLTTDELTYGHSTGATEDRDTFIKNVLAGKPDFKAIELQAPDIRIKSDVAWVRGIMHAEVLSSAGTDQIEFKILYVFIRENAAWKLLARQAVK